MNNLNTGWVIKHKKHGYYFTIDTKNIFWTSVPQNEGLFVFKNQIAAKRQVAFFCSGKLKMPFNRQDFSIIPYRETGLNLVPLNNE
jgi:hypothetical protein